MQLNKAQKHAVTHDGSPLLVIAGAGTGKTTVITERIKWLIQEKNIPPEAIAALTFTEKAAMEMEERVDVALPLGFNQTWIMTFHGFCERILRQDIVQIGLDPSFEILSEAEVQLFIREHLFEFDLVYFRPQGNPTKFIGGLSTHFSRLKDENIFPEDYEKWVEEKRAKLKKSTPEEEKIEIEKYAEVAQAYKKYEELKIKESVMDFGDLLTNTMRLFRERPNVLQKYQHKFKHLLVDEFQDTNYIQNHLAIMLAGDDQEITVVADDDQSIYRWRGAAVYNVLDFKKHFPSAEIITLTKNYRSRQEILDYAYDLIQHNNPDRLEAQEGLVKKLTAEADFPAEDRPVELIWQEKVEDEAMLVVNEIVKLVESGKCDYKDCAILVRANNHAEPFTRLLAHQGIPYQFLGPGKLFRQTEIKNLIAYLQFVDRFQNDLALTKVLSMPVWQIAGRDIKYIGQQARKRLISMYEFIEKLVQNADEFEHGMSAQTIKQYAYFYEMTHRHLDHAVNGWSAGKILYAFLEDSGLLKRMQNPSNELEVKEIENISAFFNVIKKYEVRHVESRLEDFVGYLDFLLQMGESPMASEVDWTNENAVNIITIHSAKGLEFKTVFVVNMVHRRFPSDNRSDTIPLPEDIIKEPAPVNDPHLSEERRLFYVAMTRAKERLYLTGAKFYHEAKRAKKISPFVQEALGEKLEPFLLAEEVKKDPLAELVEFDQQFKSSLTTVIGEIAQPQITYLSYSQIETFLTCPLHYKLSYILEIPTLPSAALTFGTTIHDTLRDVYQLMRSEQIKKDAELMIKQAMVIYAKRWSPIGFKDRVHAKKAYAEGEKMIREFIQTDLKRDAEVIYLEEGFNFHIKDNLRVGGRIDRVDKLPNGEYEIIDYKTGNVPSARNLKKEPKSLQPTIYLMAAVHPQVLKLDLEKVTFSYIYLKTGEKISFQRTMDELTAAKKRIIEIRAEIEESDFSCSQDYICRSCDYELFCDA